MQLFLYSYKQKDLLLLLLLLCIVGYVRETRSLAIGLH
jgi:hypothetical protein